MNRKLELLLHVVADLHDFCATNAALSAAPHSGNELAEHDLDMIVAAAKAPVCIHANLPSEE